MDETQPDVVAKDADLADARTHRSAALLIIIGKSPAVLGLGSIRGDAGDDVPDLKHDVTQLRRHLLEVFFDVAFGKHLD